MLNSHTRKHLDTARRLRGGCPAGSAAIGFLPARPVVARWGRP